MSGGYTFGENNSSFVYDNRLDQLINALEKIASTEHEILQEIKELRSDIRDWRSKTDGGYWK